MLNPGERWRCECGDALAVARSLPDQCVQCVVTSPPYFGLRDYGVEGQMGLEATPAVFIDGMVTLFREVRRVLRDDGTLWVNMGDTYAAGGLGGGSPESKQRTNHGSVNGSHIEKPRKAPDGWKQKDLLGMPWRLAFALQADGWYLRQDIIWSKPNPMPESVTDRCTKAHEYLFLLSKRPRYYFDADAISEPCEESNDARPRMGQGPNTQYAQKRKKMVSVNNKTFRGGGAYTKGRSFDNSADAERESHGNVPNESGKRNKRSVWEVCPVAYKQAHFATFPPLLIEPCILAGSRPDDIVYDPFAGSGTTLAVAVGHGRRAFGSELNPKYCRLIEKRMRGVTPSFAEACA